MTDPTDHLQMAELKGAACVNLHDLSTISLGACAIALSRGGAPKRYEYVDPNEDAAAFALDTNAAMLVVADAHNGHEAAAIAVDSLLARARSLLAAPYEDWPATANAAIADAHAEIMAAVARGARDTSRTTLSFVVIRPGEDWLGFANVGDSHIYQVGSAESFDLGYHPDRFYHFLGDPARSPGELVANTVAGIGSLDDLRAVVLATDGLSERGIGVDVPETTISECTTDAERCEPHLRSIALARGVAEQTLAAQARHKAGDNIATAAWVSL